METNRTEIQNKLNNLSDLLIEKMSDSPMK